MNRADQHAALWRAYEDARPEQESMVFYRQPGTWIAQVHKDGLLSLVSCTLNAEDALKFRDWLTEMFEEPKGKVEL